MSNIRNNLSCCKNLKLVEEMSDSSLIYSMEYNNIDIPLKLETYSGFSLRILFSFAKAHSSDLRFHSNSLERVEADIYPCTLIIEEDDLHFPLEFFWNGNVIVDENETLWYVVLPIGGDCIVSSYNSKTGDTLNFIYDFEKAKQEFNLVAKENEVTNLF